MEENHWLAGESVKIGLHINDKKWDVLQYSLATELLVWTDIPVKEEQNGQHGLVNVAVADALVEQEAGVPDHRLQGILPHDVVQLVRVQVLVHQLVSELSEVIHAGAGGASWQAPRGTVALRGAAGQGVIASTGQVQAAGADVQANGRAAVIVWHVEGQKTAGEQVLQPKLSETDKHKLETHAEKPELV